MASTALAVTPAGSRSRAAASFCGSRPTIVTRDPAVANARAAASPMPLLPPNTMTWLDMRRIYYGASPRRPPSVDAGDGAGAGDVIHRVEEELQRVGGAELGADAGALGDPVDAALPRVRGGAGDDGDSLGAGLARVGEDRAHLRERQL